MKITNRILEWDEKEQPGCSRLIVKKRKTIVTGVVRREFFKSDVNIRIFPWELVFKKDGEFHVFNAFDDKRKVIKEKVKDGFVLVNYPNCAEMLRLNKKTKLRNYLLKSTIKLKKSFFTNIFEKIKSWKDWYGKTYRRRLSNRNG